MELGTKSGESKIMNKFLSEILGQPKSLESTLDFYCSEEGINKLKKIKELLNKGNYKNIIFTGMGSSYFTSYAAACLFNRLGIHSFAINTSELIYYHSSILSSKVLVVCISQSGESYEVVKFIEELAGNISCLGVSNENESYLSKNAAETLLSKAGKEEMTSTKTYTTLTLVIAILGWYLMGKWGNDKITQVKKLIADSEVFLANYESIMEDKFSFFGNVDFVQFIGRGPLFANAQQSELMFKEAAKIAAAGTLGGEFRHGPMEMIKPGFKSIMFAADGKTYKQSIRMAADIAKYNGKVLIITNKDTHTSDPNIKVIVMNQQDEYLFAVQSIMPVQLLVNHLALENGFEPGNFVHGGKITLTE